MANKVKVLVAWISCDNVDTLGCWYDELKTKVFPFKSGSPKSHEQAEEQALKWFDSICKRHGWNKDDDEGVYCSMEVHTIEIPQ